jgi:antitoxin ParD1/3/4
MPTRNVVLTDRHEALIGRLLESGQYQNASEILRDGLRLLEAREAEEAAKLVALREAVQVGLDDIARGAFREFADFDEFGDFLRSLVEEAIAAPEQGCG